MVSGLCGGEGLDDFGGLADFAPTGEVPGVGEAAALLRFDGLDAAVLALEEDTGSVGLIDEGEAAAVGAEAGVGPDELGFVDLQEGGDGGDLFF